MEIGWKYPDEFQKGSYISALLFCNDYSMQISSQMFPNVPNPFSYNL